VNIQKNLDHPNVACLFEAFVDPKYIYIITEHCTGGELYNYNKENQFDEQKAAKVMKNVF